MYMVFGPESESAKPRKPGFLVHRFIQNAKFVLVSILGGLNWLASFWCPFKPTNGGFAPEKHAQIGCNSLRMIPCH